MSSNVNQRAANHGSLSPSATPTELEADIARHRESLAANVDELVDRLHPRSLARHSASRARAWVGSTDGEGGAVRPERLAAVVAALVTVLAVLALMRRGLRRRASVPE